MVEGCVSSVSISRPSSRVTWPLTAPSSVEICECELAFIAASSVATSECEAAWTSRLRPPSPVQSNVLRLFSLLSCFCMFFCFACVLHLFSCFSFYFCVSGGGQPKLLVDPRVLFPSLLLCLSPSWSCLWSFRCLVGFRSCINSLPSVLILCLARPLDLLSLNAAHVLPRSSWLVFRCGVGCGDIVAGALGGGLGLGASRLLRLLARVPYQMLPLVASRWLLEPSLDHEVACIRFARTLVSRSLAAMASRFVCCSFGRFAPLGDMCRPGCLVLWEGAGGCRAQTFRCVSSRVCIYTPVANGSADMLCHCMADEYCGDCGDVMDASIGQTFYSGLRHAGDTPSPDKIKLAILEDDDSEEEDEQFVCPMTEQKWESLPSPVIIHSGACASVMPSRCCPHVPIKKTKQSEARGYFRAADGSKIYDEG